MMLERGSESQKAVPPRSMREATSMELNADLALFAEEDRPLIERYLQGERVAPEEQRRRDLVIQEWWQKNTISPINTGPNGKDFWARNIACRCGMGEGNRILTSCKKMYVLERRCFWLIR